MKFTAWRTWLWNRLGRFLRPKRPRTLATAGCVALGLATTWGGEAEADITFKVEVTPAHDLLGAFVYFGNNATGPTLLSLGPLEANATHSIRHTLSPVDLSLSPDWFDRVFQPNGRFPLGYAIGGIYERGDYGITVSFPDESPIEKHMTWEEFSLVRLPGDKGGQEGYIVDQYFDALPNEPNHWHRTALDNVYSYYTQDYNDSDNPDDYRAQQYLTSYGEEATLSASATPALPERPSSQ